MVWKLYVVHVCVDAVGCVRTIVVWKHIEGFADPDHDTGLRENHSGMETDFRRAALPREWRVA